MSLNSCRELINPEPSHEVEFTMENILNDSYSLEGWLFGKKNKELTLVDILKDIEKISDDSEIIDMVKKTFDEFIKSMETIGLKYDKSVLDKVIKENNKSKYPDMVFSKKAKSDLVSLMIYFAFIYSPDDAFEWIPMPIIKDEDRVENKILYNGEHIVIVAEERSWLSGNDRFEAEVYCKFKPDHRRFPSKARQKAIRDFKEDFVEHVNSKLEKLKLNSRISKSDMLIDDEDFYASDEPHLTLEEYKSTLFVRHDGGGNYTAIAEKNGLYIAIDWDHETVEYSIY